MVKGLDQNYGQDHAFAGAYPVSMPFCPECEAFNSSLEKRCSKCGASLSKKRKAAVGRQEEVEEEEEGEGEGEGEEVDEEGPVRSKILAALGYSALAVAAVAILTVAAVVYGVAQAPMQTVAACAVVAVFLYFWRGK